MEYSKLPLDYSQILQLLKGRGLIIRIRNVAERIEWLIADARTHVARTINVAVLFIFIDYFFHHFKYIFRLVFVKAGIHRNGD